MIVHRRRLNVGFIAVALVVPAVLGIGAIGLSLVPGLATGIAPLTLFMAAAGGLSGVFFFTYLFGAPAALAVAGIVYVAALPRMRRAVPIGCGWAVTLGAMLGAALLPAVWAIQGSGPWIARFAGPALLGGLAGAAGAAVFWRIVLRPMRQP